MDLRKFKHILVTDVGSTTTKALLIARKGERYLFAPGLLCYHQCLIEP